MPGRVFGEFVVASRALRARDGPLKVQFWWVASVVISLVASVCCPVLFLYFCLFVWFVSPDLVLTCWEFGLGSIGLEVVVWLCSTVSLLCLVVIEIQGLVYQVLFLVPFWQKVCQWFKPPPKLCLLVENWLVRSFDLLSACFFQVERCSEVGGLNFWVHVLSFFFFFEIWVWIAGLGLGLCGVTGLIDCSP